MLEENKFCGEIGKCPKPKIEINPHEIYKPELIYIKVVQTDNSDVSMDYYTKYIQNQNAKKKK